MILKKEQTKLDHQRITHILEEIKRKSGIKWKVSKKMEPRLTKWRMNKYLEGSQNKKEEKWKEITIFNVAFGSKILSQML